MTQHDNGDAGRDGERETSDALTFRLLKVLQGASERPFVSTQTCAPATLEFLASLGYLKLIPAHQHKSQQSRYAITQAGRKALEEADNER